MADVKSLVDIPTEQTSAATGDLLYIVKAGVPAKITWANLFNNNQSYSSTFTLASSGTMNLSAGSVSFSNDQIPGLKVQVATVNARGAVELATDAEAQDSSVENRAVTPKAMHASTLGNGQAWQNVAGSRSVGTSYRNTTGRPIALSIRFDVGSGKFLQVAPDGSGWISIGQSGDNEALHVFGIVPPMHYYRLIGGGFGLWAELR